MLTHFPMGLKTVCLLERGHIVLPFFKGNSNTYLYLQAMLITSQISHWIHRNKTANLTRHQILERVKWSPLVEP